jgi:hypothetical protein
MVSDDTRDCPRLARSEHCGRFTEALDRSNDRLGEGPYGNRYVRAAPPLRGSTVRNWNGFSLAACFQEAGICIAGGGVRPFRGTERNNTTADLVGL